MRLEKLFTPIAEVMRRPRVAPTLEEYIILLNELYPDEKKTPIVNAALVSRQLEPLGTGGELVHYVGFVSLRTQGTHRRPAVYHDMPIIHAEGRNLYEYYKGMGSLRMRNELVAQFFQHELESNGSGLIDSAKTEVLLGDTPTLVADLITPVDNDQSAITLDDDPPITMKDILEEVFVDRAKKLADILENNLPAVSTTILVNTNGHHDNRHKLNGHK